MSNPGDELTAFEDSSCLYSGLLLVALFLASCSKGQGPMRAEDAIRIAERALAEADFLEQENLPLEAYFSSDAAFWIVQGQMRTGGVIAAVDPSSKIAVELWSDPFGRGLEVTKLPADGVLTTASSVVLAANAVLDMGETGSHYTRAERYGESWTVEGHEVPSRTISAIDGAFLGAKDLVKNRDIAMALARALWTDTYGHKSGLLLAGLLVQEDESYWIVRGTLPQGFKGGVPVVRIRERDGKVFGMTHGK